MICHECGRNLQSIRKRKVRMLDNIEVAYDIHCPHCGEKIACVFWGELFPSAVAIDDLDETGVESIESGWNEHGTEISPVPDSPYIDRRGDNRRKTRDRRKHSVLGNIPERRRGGDRRTEERRSGEDRRKKSTIQDRRMNRQGFLYDRRCSLTDRRKRPDFLSIDRST